MKLTTRATLIVSCVISLAIVLGAQDMPTKTTETIKGTPKVTTQELSGIVDFVEGNTLVVVMDSGEVRTFHPPASRRFIIDGKEVTLHDLRPGTKLKATITTLTTPVTERTTTVGSGKVVHVKGDTVVLKLPNGEDRTYTVQPSYQFEIEGKPATVKNLKKGMIVQANMITEDPKVEIARNTVVTGEAPPVTPVAAETPKELAAAAPAPSTPNPPRQQRPNRAPATQTRASAESFTSGKLIGLIALVVILCVLAVLWMRSAKRPGIGDAPEVEVSRRDPNRRRWTAPAAQQSPAAARSRQGVVC